MVVLPHWYRLQLSTLYTYELGPLTLLPAVASKCFRQSLDLLVLSCDALMSGCNLQRSNLHILLSFLQIGLMDVAVATARLP